MATIDKSSSRPVAVSADDRIPTVAVVKPAAAGPLLCLELERGHRAGPALAFA